jgi:hypothetical protein
MFRTTIYLGDYVLPTEKLTVDGGNGGLVGWGPDSRPAELVELDGIEAILKYVGGMTGYSKDYEPEKPLFFHAPIAKLERVLVFLRPQRVSERYTRTLAEYGYTPHPDADVR